MLISRERESSSQLAAILNHHTCGIDSRDRLKASFVILVNTQVLK